MPSPLVQNVAQRCGYPMKTVYGWWEDACNEVKERFNRSENDQDYWTMVTSLVKVRAGRELAKCMAEKGDTLSFADPNRVKTTRAGHVILSALLREMVADQMGNQIARRDNEQS